MNSQYEWLSQELDALDAQPDVTPLPPVVAEPPRVGGVAGRSRVGEAARKWRAERAEAFAEYERQEAEYQANLMTRLATDRAEQIEKRRKAGRVRKAKWADNKAVAEGRVIRRRLNLKDMTPEQVVAHRREQKRESMRRKRAKNPLASNPLYGKF